MESSIYMSNTRHTENLWWATAWRFRDLLDTGVHGLKPLKVFKSQCKLDGQSRLITQGGNRVVLEEAMMWICLLEFYAKLLHMVPDYLVPDPTLQARAFNPFTAGNPPQLYRYWCACSHTDYSGRYGFRCSSWRECVPQASLTYIGNDKPAALEHLRNHCHNEPTPSSYISTSEDISWIYRETRRRFPFGHCSSCGVKTRVACISVNKLEHIKIPFDRSTTLVILADGRPHSQSPENIDGVSFAWHEHWLVYGWIPQMCITQVMTVEEFWRVWDERGLINRG